MLNKKYALIPGSFDPPTIGHYDLAVRAAEMFEHVWVTAFVNAKKAGSFTDEEKLALLSAAFRGIPNITVDLSNGLLADYAVWRGIGTLVKGARNATDFDYELSLSLINRSLEPELDTIILPTRAEYQHISSTMVREMIRYGKDYSRVVPCGTAELIAEYVNKNR